MSTERDIMLAVRDTIAAVAALKYVDQDWGQLQTEVPAVNWPCALVSLSDVEYKLASVDNSHGVGTIAVTYADIMTGSTAATSATADESFGDLDILGDIDAALSSMETEGEFSVPYRMSLRRLDTPKGYNAYIVNYRVAW